MDLLVLEPYYDGSHKAFLEGWRNQSHHKWALLQLPGYTWKWRMRHSAITFAQEIHQQLNTGRQRWDCILCSDMLNLAEFKGLAPPLLRDCPTVVYFHENQLTYPVRVEHERDYQFAMTNFSTALAADAVWFNSQYHCDAFLTALRSFFARMPDYAPTVAVDLIQQKSEVHCPGIEVPFDPRKRRPGPARILWAARWEHDKNPEDFFAALRELRQRAKSFRLSVIGQGFQEQPPIFKQAHAQFAAHIDHWGFQQSRQAYLDRLREADIVVSTANHEFFGIGMIEAMAAGAFPLLPQRLAYPEIMGLGQTPGVEAFFYDGSVRDLTHRLCDLVQALEQGRLWHDVPDCQRLAQHFQWQHRAPEMDRAVAALF